MRTFSFAPDCQSKLDSAVGSGFPLPPKIELHGNTFSIKREIIPDILHPDLQVIVLGEMKFAPGWNDCLLAQSKS